MVITITIETTAVDRKSSALTPRCSRGIMIHEFSDHDLIFLA